MNMLVAMPDFFQKLFTEAGLVAVLLTFAVIYQTRQLGKERNKTDSLNGQILQLATAQIRAMMEVQNVLEKVVDLTPPAKKE